MEHIFSYGTLQQPEVQVKTFGRLLEGFADELTGYKISLLPIDDPEIEAANGMTHYNNLLYTGKIEDCIKGMVLLVTEDELRHADAYEKKANYVRVTVPLKSGKTCWVFVSAGKQSGTTSDYR